MSGVSQPDDVRLAGISGFDLLTRAEAAVFERYLREQPVAAGEPLPTDDAVVIVRDGAIDLAVGPSGDAGEIPVARLEAGGMTGEVPLFDPTPLAVTVRGAGAGSCLVIDRSDLKQGFRYSRTSAVKWMVRFASSLSDKLRQANDRLRAAAPAKMARTIHADRLSELDLDRLKAFCVHRSFAAGAEVFVEGDSSEELYVIDSGEVDISRTPPAGAVMTLAHLGPGDFFGEMSFVDRRPRSACARATSELTVHVLPAGTLERVIEHSLGTGLYLTDVICKIIARRLDATLRALVAGDT